jgi:hypothetical protein
MRSPGAIGAETDFDDEGGKRVSMEAPGKAAFHGLSSDESGSGVWGR